MGRIRRSLVILALIAAAPVPAVAPARADESPQVAALAEALADDFDYRVQVQAALAMGEVADPSVVPHLVAALDDAHPLVRAAAANSLARVGDAGALEALRAVGETDPTAREAVENAVLSIESRLGLQRPYVPPSWSDARMYVAVGDLADGSASGVDGLAGELRSALIARLRRMSGVIVGSEARPSDEVLVQLDSHRSVFGLMLTGSITDVATLQGPMTVSVYVKVSIIALEYRGQAIRTMLTGTATSQAVKERACEIPVDELRHTALARAAAAAIDGLEREMSRLSRLQRLDGRNSGS